MRRFLILIACAAMTSTPVIAQSDRISRNDDLQTGTRFKRKAEEPDMAKQRAMQKDVARCVVYRNKTLSRRLISGSDNANIDFEKMGIDPDELFDELDVDECLGRAAKKGTLSIYMTIPFRTLRNLMVEEVYLMDNKKAPVLAGDDPVYLANRFYAPGNSRGAEMIAEISDCLVHRSVELADAFVRTRPGTKNEGKALDALSPTLVHCAGESITQAEIETSTIRAVVADGLWARVHYGPDAPATASEDANTAEAAE